MHVSDINFDVNAHSINSFTYLLLSYTILDNLVYKHCCFFIELQLILGTRNFTYC